MESQGNKAGTDFPRYYDEKNDTWYEGSWNSIILETKLYMPQEKREVMAL